MPELPEVETIARDLQRSLPGGRVAAARVFWPRSVARPSPVEFCARVVGQTIESVDRRGKFLVLALSRDTLLVHLRMTGQLLLDAVPSLASDGRLADPHVHAVLDLSSGVALVFRDVRKFGRLWLVHDPQQVLGDLGPEPLGEALTPERLYAMLHGRRRRLKDLLLDQTFLAGLGNIYVDEALWEARLGPRRLGSTLDAEEGTRLHGAIRGVLERAIAARGTTLRDYRDPHNLPGENQYGLNVYGRAAQACPRCGAEIVRDVVAGRGTHFCPTCQGGRGAMGLRLEEGDSAVCTVSSS